MPSKPPTACKRPGCSGLVRNDVCSVCGSGHRQALTEPRKKTAERGYGWSWQKLRLMVLRQEPLCRHCQMVGIVTPAIEVDHIIPKSLGGADSFENLQPLCTECHVRKGFFERRMFAHMKGGSHVAKVTLVIGPPGAGKTTYVRNHMGANDIVLDVDALVSALSGRPWYDRPQAAWDIALDLRSLLILRLAKPSDVETAWVIASEPDDRKRMELAKQVHARTVLVLPVSAEECIERIRQDERRSNNLGYWYNAVTDWWTRYVQAPIDTVIAMDSSRREGG